MTPEAALYLDVLRRTATHFFRALDGLDADALNRRPAGDGTNSLYVLTAHTLANVERNVLNHFGGRPYEWRRDEEFAARGDTTAPLREHWARLEPLLAKVLGEATAGDLDRLYEHPNMGSVPGRAILMRAVTHAREHLGQATLTRDLWEGAAQSAVRRGLH